MFESNFPWFARNTKGRQCRDLFHCVDGPACFSVFILLHLIFCWSVNGSRRACFPVVFCMLLTSDRFNLNQYNLCYGTWLGYLSCVPLSHVLPPCLTVNIYYLQWCLLMPRSQAIVVRWRCVWQWILFKRLKHIHTSFPSPPIWGTLKP